MLSMVYRPIILCLCICLIVLTILPWGSSIPVAANGLGQGETARVIPDNLPKITASNASHLVPFAKLGQGTPQNLRWTRNGSRLIVIGHSSLWFYDADDFSVPSQHLTLSSDFHRVTDADLSPDGEMAVVAELFSVQLWDMSGNQEPIVLTEYPSPLSQIAIAFNPDGRVAYATPAFSVELFEIETGETVTFEGHVGHIRGLAFSPDGLLLATASEDGTARLWNTQNGQEIQQFSLESPALVSVTFGPNGTLLAMSGGRGFAAPYNPNDSVVYPVGVFDLVTNEQILSDTTTMTPNRLSFSADGGRLVVTATPSTSAPIINGQYPPHRAMIYDLGDGAVSEAPIDGNMRQFRFSPRGDQIAFIGDLGPQVLSAADYSVQSTLPYFGFIQYVDFDPDANVMMWQAGFSTQVIDLETGLVGGELLGVAGRQFTDDGTLIALSQDDDIQWRDVETQSLLRGIDTSGDSVGIMVLSEDESRLVYNTGEGQIKLWDVEAQTLVFEAILEAPIFGEMRFSDDGELVIHNAHNRIRIWDAATGSVVIDLQNVKIGANAVSPDGRLMAYQLNDEDIVNLADSQTGEILAQFPIVTGDGTGIQFNNSGTLMTVASSNYIGGDGAVHVIDVESREEIALYDFKGFPWGAIFSPDDRFMTLVGESEALAAQIVELWNLETGEKVGTVEGITGASRIQYNTDQSLLISGAGTSPASLIDTQTATVLFVFEGQGSGATAYWFSPDETFIATGAGDGTMWLWGVVE